MTIILKKNFTENSRNLMRDCGYLEIFDRKTGKFSFVKKLRGDHYPRFHVYINKEAPGLLQLNMHLDMKKPTYEGFTAHSGEYSGPLVEQEAARIQKTLESLVANPSSAKPAPLGKKSLWSSMFGGSSGDNTD